MSISFSEPRYCWIFTLWWIWNICCKALHINICPFISVFCAHTTMKYDCFHVYMHMLYTNLSCGRCISSLCFCMDECSRDQPIAYGFDMWVTWVEHSTRLQCLYVNITAQKCAHTSMLKFSAFNETRECWSSFSPKSFPPCKWRCNTSWDQRILPPCSLKING